MTPSDRDAPGLPRDDRSRAGRPAATVRPRLRHRTADVLADTLSADEVFRLDAERGNHDLLQLIKLFGLEGPLRPINPWELEDARGQHLIHAGSYAATPFGEAYPGIVEFARSFLARQPSTVGFPQQSASAWRAALQDTLIGILAEFAPSHADSQVFLSNSGAEAIETALKLVRAARPKATTLVNFSRAYHGKTLGALSLTPNEEYQAPFRPLLGPVRTLPYGDAEVLESALSEIGWDRVQAIVVEPIQGEAGVITPPAGFLRRLGALASEHGIPVVADEIQSGLGRAGHWFASVADGLDPDIITLAKPLGGGLVPIGATIARRDLFRAMLRGSHAKRHSNTFGGGSFACAVALRSLELISEEGLVEKARADGAYGLERLRAIQADHPHLIGAVRGAGLLFALDIKAVLPSRLIPIDPSLLPFLAAALGIAALHRAGVHACYSNNGHGVVRLTPPLTIPRPTLVTLFDRVEAMADRHRRPLGLLRLLHASEMARLVRLAF
jgi:putrescine aminotransferase